MPTVQTAILPYCYLAPVDYYVALLKYPTILFEAHEHFVKQTYRSRCSIYGPNGVIKLVIPVQHTGERTKMKDMRIAYTEPWQKLHWRSFEAAYRSSPFFEYYEDDLAPFYQKKFDFLVDFNEQLQSKVLELLKTELSFSMTNSYEEKYPDTTDYRNEFHTVSEPTPYTQVFDSRHGFIPNLSIADLLFNEGPHAADYLHELLPDS